MSSLLTNCAPMVEDFLNAVDSPAVLIDRNYIIQATNQSYHARYGSAQDYVGQCCFAVSHHYGKPCHEMGEECPMLHCMETDQPHRVLHLHHTPEGEEHVDVEMVPVHDSNGECVAFVEIIRHIKKAGTTKGQELIGRSPAFNKMMEYIARVADSDATVLLLGESGTGKELAAMALHRGSEQADGPFVPVDCSGLTESLFESELFGHEKGAFTGALSQKQGLVEAARGGTLFLDEIGDVPLSLQVKLLRLLETGTYRRVGSVEPRQTEFRLVCATHRHLQQMVEEGSFRQDLFFRINTFPIELPSLSERREDLPLLIAGLLERIRPGHKIQMSTAAMNKLMAYRFPGNVRELRNILERAVLLSGGKTIETDHLYGLLGNGNKPKEEEAFSPPTEVVSLKELETNYLNWLSQHYQGDNRSLAYELGVSERTLYRKLEAIKTS